MILRDRGNDRPRRERGRCQTQEQSSPKPDTHPGAFRPPTSCKKRPFRLSSGSSEREKVLSKQLDSYSNKPALQPPPSQPTNTSYDVFSPSLTIKCTSLLMFPLCPNHHLYHLLFCSTMLSEKNPRHGLKATHLRNY